MNNQLRSLSPIEGVTFHDRHSAVFDGMMIPPTEVTTEMVESLLSLNKDVIYYARASPDDVIGIVFYATTGRDSARPISCYKVFVSDDWDPTSDFSMNHSMMYPITAKEDAIKDFIRRVTKGEIPEDRKTFSEEDIRVATYGWEAFTSQYNYCNAMLEEFWKEVFGKTPSEMWCGGIVSAHGDKCYGYQHEWKTAGIHFFRATMLYLLSYTAQYKKESRVDVEKWVIEQYPNFLPIFEKIETKVLKEKYTFK